MEYLENISALQNMKKKKVWKLLSAYTFGWGIGAKAVLKAAKEFEKQMQKVKKITENSKPKFPENES